MLLPIELHSHAVSDLAALKADDINMAAKMGVFLRELKTDEKLQDRMLEHKQHETTKTAKFEFQKFVELFKQGAEVWRIKICEAGEKQSLPYRIIYAHHPWTQLHTRSFFMVLAIVHRKFDYEITSPITQRILKDYTELLSSS